MTDMGTTIDLVGRARLVEDIVAALDESGGFGVMIVGAAGMGKTAVARSVLKRLNWTAPVLRITGGPSLRSIPFGALAPYLHTLSVADAGSPVAVLRAVLGHLTGESTGRTQHPPLLVIDDAHELDSSSSALLAQLVSARRAKVLVMSRDVTTAPVEFRSLGADGLLARFDLAPLDPDAVSALSSQLLGGPVLTGTAHTLALTTGGNPLFLRALLEQGPGEGYLGRHDGVWRQVTERPMLSPRLRDLVRSQLRLRSAADLEALETVALAEPIALDTVVRCVDADALNRLRDDRLIAVGPGPGAPVSVEHPLHGEVLRSQVPAARSTAIRRKVLAATEPGSQSLEGFLRMVVWGLDCGVPPDDRELLEAATVANGLRDSDVALRTARAVSAPGLRGRALIEIARVHARRGDLAYAREVVDDALRRCTDLRLAKDATLLSQELKLSSLASYEDLREDVDRWRSLIARVELQEGARLPAEEVARAQLGCRILECRVLVLQGRFAGIEDELRDLIAGSRGTPEAHVGAMIVLAELLGNMGRPVDASAFSAAALDSIDAAGAALLGYREFAAAQHVLALCGRGQEAEAKAVLQAYSRVQPCSIVYLAGWSDVIDGHTALREGRNREARSRFLLALQALRGSDATHVTTLLTGLAAYACALAGDTAGAAALVDAFEGTPEQGSRAMTVGGRIFVTATAALLGDVPGATAELVSIAAEAEAAQMKQWAVTALRLSLLLGNTDSVGPLTDVLQDFQGACTTGLLDFAVAAGTKDADAMVAAATAGGAHGDVAFEYAGLSVALQLAGEQGSSRSARAIQRRLVTLGKRWEGPVPPALVSASAAETTSRLTPTERTIVALVNEGYSNREIADAKNVSVRTVEGHLYRIFAKLGVNRREDLRES